MSWGDPHTIAAPVDLAKLPQSDPRWIAERDRLLAAWENAKNVLSAAKETEGSSRIAFGDFAFPVDSRKAGVNKLELNHGYVAKLGHKINHKIVASNAAVEEAEDIAPTLGNQAQFLFERIITWEAKFSVGEYNKLKPLESAEDKKLKELVDTLIEVTNGMPSLEIIAPKATLNG